MCEGGPCRTPPREGVMESITALRCFIWGNGLVPVLFLVSSVRPACPSCFWFILGVRFGARRDEVSHSK